MPSSADRVAESGFCNWRVTLPGKEASFFTTIGLTAIYTWRSPRGFADAAWAGILFKSLSASAANWEQSPVPDATLTTYSPGGLFFRPVSCHWRTFLMAQSARIPVKSHHLRMRQNCRGTEAIKTEPKEGL